MEPVDKTLVGTKDETIKPSGGTSEGTPVKPEENNDASSPDVDALPPSSPPPGDPGEGADAPATLVDPPPKKETDLSPKEDQHKESSVERDLTPNVKAADLSAAQDGKNATTTTTVDEALTGDSSTNGETGNSSNSGTGKKNKKKPTTDADKKKNVGSSTTAVSRDVLAARAAQTTTTTTQANNVSRGNSKPLKGPKRVWQVMVVGYRNRHKESPRTVTGLAEDGDKDDADLGRMLGLASTGFGHASSTLGVVSSALTLDSGIHASKDKNYNENEPDAYMKNRSEAGGLLRFCGGASSVFGSIMGLAGVYNDNSIAKKKGLKNKRRQSRVNAAAGLTGLGASVLSMASAAVGLRGDDPKTAGWLGIASRGLGLVGSLTKTISAGMSAHRHRKVANATNTLNRQDMTQYSDLLNNEDQSIKHPSRVSNDPKIKNKDRATAKARLYAMKQAERYNDAKASQEKSRALREGITGIGADLSGGIGSLFSIFGGKSPAGMIGSGVFGLLGSAFKLGGSVANAIGKRNDKKAYKDSKSRMRSEVDDFVNKKLDKIKNEAQSKRNDNPGNTDLSADEFDWINNSGLIQKKIAIARLGIDLTLDENDIDDGVYKQAFNAITMRRAYNILNSNDNERNSMLTALGLPTTTDDVVEIAEALGYEG